MINFLDERLPSNFWDKCTPEPTTGCWLWFGDTDADGYGRRYFRINSKKKVELVHRTAYQALVGPIAAGLCIDHLCRTRCCVNPAHLEAVTPLENQRRGLRGGIQGGLLTHCKHGHAFSGNNFRMQQLKSTLKRVCKICEAAAQARYAARKRAA